MSARSYTDALMPAICGTAAGGCALLIGASGGVVLAVATLCTAGVALLRMPEDAGKAGPRRNDTSEQLADRPLRSERGVLAAFEAMPIGVLIVAPDRTIILANPQATQIFGVRNAVGSPVANLRARRLLDRIENALQHQASSVLDFNLSRNGDVFLKSHIIALGTGGVLVTLQDETQTRRAGELHRDFVANASHELKTPLAATTGIIETLLGHARNDPDATERFLNLLASQTDRMARLVSDLLSLNRIELNERMVPEQAEDVFKIVAEAIDALAPIAEASNVTLKSHLPAIPKMVLADRDELGQLFHNLIENAIKYGGEHSRVDICFCDTSLDHQGMIGIEVIDQGPGIAREHLPRLTERFYRVNARHSREKGGTGLGLAIVKHILNRHRGYLQIESTVGDGSQFRVWLPVLTDADESDQSVSASQFSADIRP